MSTRSRAPNQPTFVPIQVGILQRKCSSCGQHTFAGGECRECKQKKSPLQRRAINQTETSEVPRSPSQLLDTDPRAFMKSRFEHDFSRVRLHTDDSARSRCNFLP
jgi:Domain of unknown function (DUF4157)